MLASVRTHRPISLPRTLIHLSSVALAIALAGCGKSESNSPVIQPDPPPTLISGQILDGLGVAGLGVLPQGGQPNISDANGAIQFAQGRLSEVFLGDADVRIVLGRISGNSAPNASLNWRDLVNASGQPISENRVINTTRLLQALDQDSNYLNGISLDAAGRQTLVTTLRGQPEINLDGDPQAFGNQPSVGRLLSALSRQLPAVDRAIANFGRNFTQFKSRTLALTRDGQRLIVTNRPKNTVSILRVREANGIDTQFKLAEVAVGQEPRFVALSPDDRKAFVSNAIDGTISVIDLTANTPQVTNTISVGTEPRGLVVSPNGRFLIVALHTSAEVAFVDLQTLGVIAKVPTGGNPLAVAISNDGDRDDLDEQVYVSRAFGELAASDRPDGFNDAKRGVIDVISLAQFNLGQRTAAQLFLSPLQTGFTADRRNFCPQTRLALQQAGTVRYFNSGADGTGNGAGALAKTTFCPDVATTDISAEGPIARVAQLAYPNMLNSILLRGADLLVVNIAASPEPPINFNTNVQGALSVVDRLNGSETRTVNLNAQIRAETQPPEGSTSLARLFSNDLLDIEGNRFGDRMLVVSRGGNYVIRVGLDAAFKPTIQAPANVVRFETGNLPNSVVMSPDGTRAYTNNEVNLSVSVLDLVGNTTLARDVETSAPFPTGSREHRNELGKLAFFTALGLPDSLDTNGDGQFDVALRDIRAIEHRNKASDNAWSGCSSCHEDGHADNVSWIFVTGPRQTIPLEGTFARNDASDQRIFNWSGVQGSYTDFNNNARNVQGGKGFATNVRGENRTARAFNHGNVRGVSDSLDAMSDWATTIRAPIMPDPVSVAGRDLFGAQCASCHGGKKWAKSRTSPVFQNNPTFAEDPIGPSFFAGVRPLDTRLTAAGPQLQRFTIGSRILTFLDNVGTFDATSPLELRGGGAVGGQVAQGFAAFGGAGFNAPSLLGVAYSAPYLHDGSARTLGDVFRKHKLADGRTIEATLSPSENAALQQFVLAIDDQTPTFLSATDLFLQGQ